MQAAIRTGGGVIKYANDVPLPPKEKAGQVLLKVRAASINPVDYKLPKWLAGECPSTEPTSKRNPEP
jgi:NADPH:quinone reductase-like Zn-dependent oxidoreductase